MADEQIIYSANVDLTFADQLAFLRTVRPVIEAHQDDIAAQHPREQAFIDECLAACDAFVESLKVMDEELVEADGALAAHTALGEQIDSYVRRVYGLIDLIETLEEEDDGVVRALRKAYGLANNRLSFARRAHNERRIQLILAAHSNHGPLLLKYGMTQAELDEAKQIWDAMPQSAAALSKENAEKEQAVSEAHKAEAAAVKLVNKVFALVRHHQAQLTTPFADLASATAKHREKLLA
jgi:hypothetical protein